MGDRGDRENYETATENLSLLASVIESAVRSSTPDVALHAVTHRIKTKDSADRKILASPDLYSGYGDLHDLLGVRLIALFESDLDTIEGAVRKVLIVDQEKSGDKLDRHRPTEFGYRSRHLIGRLGKNRAKLDENRKFAGRLVEVQLRSLLQHAWAEIEHDLGYKPQRPIEPDIRRRFSQLAAVMELADSSFSSLRTELSGTESSELATFGSSPQSELTIAALDAFIQKDSTFKAFDRQAALKLETALSPPGGARRERIGYLLDLVAAIGWNSVSRISEAVSRYKDAALVMLDGESASNYRRILQIPEGDGLRPGFSIILLVEAAKRDGEG